MNRLTVRQVNDVEGRQERIAESARSMVLEVARAEQGSDPSRRCWKEEGNGGRGEEAKGFYTRPGRSPGHNAVAIHSFFDFRTHELTPTRTFTSTYGLPAPSHPGRSMAWRPFRVEAPAPRCPGHQSGHPLDTQVVQRKAPKQLLTWRLTSVNLQVRWLLQRIDATVQHCC